MAATNPPSEKPAADSSAASEPWEEAMRAQLAAWLKDSDWTDEAPAMTVSVGSHALCQLDGVATVALPPDAVFSIVCDPHNKRVFKNIKSVKSERVISDTNGVKELELDMVFAFQLPFFTGTFDAHMHMVHDRPNRKMTFALTRPGLMRKFEGYWQVEPLLVPASAPSSSALFPSTSSFSAASFSAASATSVSAPPSPMADDFQPGSPWADHWASNSACSSPDHDFAAHPAADLASDPAAKSAAEVAAARAAAASIAPVVPPGMRVASRLVLRQIVQPSVAPPAILKRCIHTILHMATRDVLAVFQREAAIIRSTKGGEENKTGAGSGSGGTIESKVAAAEKKVVAAATSLGSRVWGLLSSKA